MTEHEYQEADRELFAMLNGEKPTAGKTVGFVVSKKRARELDELERKFRRMNALKPVIGSTGAATIFFGAVVFGWMDPAFGAAVTLAAAARAVSLFWRYRHGSK